MTTKWCRAAVVASVVLVLAACGSNEPSSEPVEPSTTLPPSTTSPPVTTTSTSAPATSPPTEPTTTAPPSGPTTSAVPVPAPLEPPADPLAWEARELGGGATAPCCAEQWVGVGVSPPLGGPGQALADGFYVYAIDQWDAVEGEPALEATIEVKRFEACAQAESRGGDLPLYCEDFWPVDAVTVDGGSAVDRPLRIDEDVVVAYTGPTACGAEGVDQYVTTGAGYAVMIEQLWTDYEEWIGRFVSDPGFDEEELRERLRTDPASPFEVDPCGWGGTDVQWTSPEGVRVLLQSLGSIEHGGQRDPWELTFPVTLQVSGGQVALYVGGYFRS